MMYNFILLQVVAHLLADFTFQPQKWSIKKAEKALTKYHLFHVLVVFFFSYTLSLTPKFWWMALIITLLHFGTDVLKSALQIKSKANGRGRNYFFADQIVHVTILLIASYGYYSSFGIEPLYIVPYKLTIFLAGYLFCSKPANIIIKHIFEHYQISIYPDGEKAEHDNAPEESEHGLPNAGKLIGIMERFLVLALIWVGQFSAVGLIIAAKSILRFQSNQKNEYVLVGTLLSFGIAVLVGIGMMQIIGAV